jgi:non-ribosomal peptide synthetase component F
VAKYGVLNNIGSPINNTQVYVLNQQAMLVPIGAPGELYIGGVGLARGYLNQHELTNERFIDNPFATPDDKAKGYASFSRSTTTACLTSFNAINALSISPSSIR